jgi:hypothetical protein
VSNGYFLEEGAEKGRKGQKRAEKGLKSKI